MSAIAAALHDAGIAPELAARLEAYGRLLVDANRRVNLTGAKSEEDLAPHLLDALTLMPYVQAPYVDVGSGGGLPAIPLALALGIPVLMIESVVKKAAFLEQALAALGVEGTVVAKRAEDVARDPAYREQFSVATARAVSSAPAVLELLLPLVQVGGAVVMPRGRMDERERAAAKDAAPMLGGDLRHEIPLEGERRIVVVAKLSATPARFPRRAGVPEKRPLCM